MKPMDVPLLYLSYRPQTPRKDYWDYALAYDVFSRRAWRPACARALVEIDGFDQVPAGQGAIVVLAARHHAAPAYVERLNADMSRLPYVVLFLMGDEENAFPVYLLRHPNIRIFRMMLNPSMDVHSHHVLINGYTPHVHLLDNSPCPDKTADWFFAGQVTHARRQEFARVLSAVPGNGTLLETPGFTQGMSRLMYVQAMSRAKVAPCPSGPVAVDTFRFSEALECGAIPILDSKAPVPYDSYPGRDYWTHALGDDHPFPVIDEWRDLAMTMDGCLYQYPHLANVCSSWWINYKRELSLTLERDLDTLSGHRQPSRSVNENLCAAIFTSPSPAHPDTSHIDRVIASVRAHFPAIEIFVLCDGIRPELERARPAYEEYLRRLLWKCLHHDSHRNVLPIVFSEHLHQAKMARICLENDRWVETPLVLMLEHDTPLIIPGEPASYDGYQVDTRRPIPWQAIADTILDGSAHVVRLYHRYGMPHEHDWLMRDKVTWHGEQFWKCVQWSQRPHVASVEYYRRILFEHFSARADCYIEDRLMTFIQNRPWEENKVVIYWPGDEESMRSWHSESRCHRGEWWPKFEQEQVF